MRDYSKSCIYIIKFHSIDSLVYIGSTIRPLNVRFNCHKYDNGTSLYKFIEDNNNGDWSCCYINSLCPYPCNNADELEKKEGEYIKLFKESDYYQVINKNIAGRKLKEYYIDNAIKYQKYRDDNKELLSKKQKKYREENKELLIERKKKFYNDNKNKIAEKQKEYRNENQDKIKEKYKEIIKCECGCEITKKHLARHKKSLKHQAYIQTLQ